METHQRYLLYRDLEAQTKLHPVRNGNAEHLENVIRGNESIVARLKIGNVSCED